MSNRKLQRPERGHLENQERAYIAASRRNDRSLEARVQSARQASLIHKERTGKALRITEEIVKNEEMYEEEEDEIPRRFRILAPHMQTPDNQLNSKVDDYLYNKVAMSNMVSATHRDWQRQEEVNRLFAEAFPSLRGKWNGIDCGTLDDQGSLPVSSPSRRPGLGSPTSEQLAADPSPEPTPQRRLQSFASPESTSQLPSQSFASPRPHHSRARLSQQLVFPPVNYGNTIDQTPRGQSFSDASSTQSYQGQLGGLTHASESFSGVLPTTTAYTSSQLGMTPTTPDLTSGSHSTASQSQPTTYFGSMSQASVGGAHGSAFTPELPPEARMILDDHFSSSQIGWQEQQLPEFNKATNPPQSQVQSQESYYQGNLDQSALDWEFITHSHASDEPNWESFINEGEFNDLDEIL